MSFEIEVHLEGDIMIVNSKGIYSKRDAESKFIELLKNLNNYSVNKVLVDLRNLEHISQSNMMAFEYGEFIASKSLKSILNGKISSTKFAYLYSKEFEEVFSIGELVASNRGMNVKTFLDYKDAIKWLRET